MTSPGRLSAAELGKFLEIQNLGLNLPFAGAFLLLAAHGWPPLVPTALLIVAFVAARNAGHAFNRWTDRALDAANPRTQGRAMVTGRVSPRSALLLVGLNALVLFLAAALLNLVALLLAPVALAIVLGYSLTKRLSPLTTVVLGLVESITPAAVYIGLTGSLPPSVLLAVLALLVWGTAFESIHSLGDLDADRRAGLPSLPASLGVGRTVVLVPALHAAGLVLLGAFGIAEHLGFPYFLGLGLMAGVAAVIDRELVQDPSRSQRPFRAHFVLGGIYLIGAAAAVLL